MKPQFGTDRSGDLVTIPLAEYRELMADRVELTRLQARAAGGTGLQIKSRARFRHDRELVAFIQEHASSRTIAWLRTEALRRFGPDRAPKSSALGEYVRQVRAVQEVAASG